MHWRRTFGVGLAGVLASGLIAFQPTGSHAQAEGTAYTIIYQGTADFSYTTGSGPLAGSKSRYHADWSATADGTNLTRDAQLNLSTSTNRFPESLVGPMTFTTLTGTLSAVFAGEPRGTQSCSANFLPLPGTFTSYSLSMGPYLDNGTYALGVRAGEMPLSEDFVLSDNTTDFGCARTPPRNAFFIGRFPGVPFLKADEFERARVPLVDVLSIDPSEAFDETRAIDFDYTGAALDPNGPPGTTIYVGHIQSTIEVKTYGPLVISQ